MLAIIFGLTMVLFGYNGNNIKTIKETPYEKPPIDIEVTFSKYGHGLYWIDVISNMDSITILSTKINRGNCDNDGLPYFKINKTLKFGDSYQFYILRCQHIKEVSIKTDKGTWNFGK
ncbi:hypothetical protein [Helicobacter pylori]|uniref:hypothetical protein n=1 Tax=Helicobacter pylori TaxID=210 RepID=UPI003C6C6270